MNNLEWLYEHERDKLVKLIVGEYDMCDICFYDPNFPDCGGDCERNVREWLDDVHSEQIQDKDEHVDDESCRQDADQREHAETPTASKWQSNDAQDSREKLEADCTAAWKSVERVVRSGGTPKERWTNSEFFNLLDRQAAITTNQLTSKSDVSKSEETAENAISKCDMRDFGDSREKLEADMRERLGELWADAWDAGNRDSMDDCFDLSVFIALLDRQAVITVREIEKKWSSFSDSVDGHIAELQRKLEAAHAKNRALKAHITKMQEGRHGWHIKGKELQQQVDSLKRKLEAAIDANTDYRDEWHRVCAERERLAREIGTLRAERDRYRELCGKLLDAADDMRRVRDQFDAFTEVD